MDNNQTTAIENVNKTAAERADSAVQGISTSTIEAAPVKLNLPENKPIVPDLPIYSFTTESESERQRAGQVAEGRQQQVDALSDIYAGLADIGTKGETTARLEEAAGIPQLSRGLTEIENEIMTKSLAFRREREAITIGGGSKAQIDIILSERGRKQNQELADLEVIRAARSNTLTNAQNLINRKVELEFADKQAKVDALRFIYNENKATLDKEDDRLFQQAIRREERGFEIAKQQYIQTETEKMRYVSNAAQAGADNNTLKAIQGAKSLEELYNLPGIQRFALSQGEKLSLALQSENLINARSEREAREKAIQDRQAAVDAGQLLPEQAEVVDSIDKEFRSEPIVKEFNTAVAKKAGVDAILNSGVKGVTDIALVYEFMKSLDPESVVRETEFDTAAKAGNIFAGKFAKFNGYLQEGGGILPENVRTAFESSINQAFAMKETQYFTVKDEFGKKVNRRLGIDNGSQYLTQYDSSSILQVDEDGTIVIPGRQTNEDFFNN